MTHCPDKSPHLTRVVCSFIADSSPELFVTNYISSLVSE